MVAGTQCYSSLECNKGLTTHLEFIEDCLLSLGPLLKNKLGKLRAPRDILLLKVRAEVEEEVPELLALDHIDCLIRSAE